MIYQPECLYAIAMQRQAELLAAAHRYRLARSAGRANPARTSHHHCARSPDRRTSAGWPMFAHDGSGTLQAR
jgi:hypothetical protein